MLLRRNEKMFAIVYTTRAGRIGTLNLGIDPDCEQLNARAYWKIQATFRKWEKVRLEKAKRHHK